MGTDVSTSPSRGSDHHWHCSLKHCPNFRSGGTRPRIIMGGDFQHNPGWHPDFPTSAPSTVRALQDILPSSVLPARPVTAEPTWVSPRGHVGALDHVISSAKATITSHVEVVFPSDRIPQVARFWSIHPISPLPAIHAKGRYLLPKTPGKHMVKQFREAFGHFQPVWRHQKLNVAVMSFSKAVEHTAQTVAGPLPSYLNTPGPMMQIQTHFKRLLDQHPRWWTNPEKVKAVPASRTKIRPAWELAEVEKALQIAPIASLCVAGAPAPSKTQYRIVRKQTANDRVEATYMWRGYLSQRHC